MATKTTRRALFPRIEASLPKEVQRHLELIYGKLNNHALAFEHLTAQNAATTTAVAAVTAASGGSGSGTVITSGVTSFNTQIGDVSFFASLGMVNQQSGATAYTVLSGDDGRVLLLNDAAPIAVTLDSTLPVPWFCSIFNLGTGAATLTPTSGTINGAASFSLPGNASTLIDFDGTNWWASPVSSGGAPATNFISVHQIGHGFSTGQAVYFNGSAWALAKANVVGTVGISVILVIDANNFEAYLNGVIAGLSGLTAGQYYFVSDATPGLLTATQPTAPASYSNPLLVALSTTTGIVFPFRPLLNGTAITAVGITVDGGGNVPTTGVKGYLKLPTGCTILGWTIMADQSGSAIFDVKYATTVAGIGSTTSIVASAPPTLSSAQAVDSTTLTGWLTALPAGALMEFDLTSATTVTRVTLEITMRKT